MLCKALPGVRGVGITGEVKGNLCVVLLNGVSIYNKNLL